MLKMIVKDYSYDLLFDDALFHLAQIYEFRLLENDNSSYYYEKILLECSGSVYISEARKKYREIRGDKL